jgi:hypothetical protein
VGRGHVPALEAHGLGNLGHALLDEGDEVVVTERPTGTFTRQLFLGETLDAGNLAASYENGVLTLEIPVAEAAKPRKVEIKVGDSHARAIDAESTESHAAS